MASFPDCLTAEQVLSTPPAHPGRTDSGVSFSRGRSTSETLRIPTGLSGRNRRIPGESAPIFWDQLRFLTNKLGNNLGLNRQGSLHSLLGIKALQNLNKIASPAKFEASPLRGKSALGRPGFEPYTSTPIQPIGQRVTRIAEFEPPLEISPARIKAYGFCQLQR